MIKVRFAPSPTGYLHIGGARTALFNWMYARANNGQFILRIEDTDLERSKKEYESEILKSMKWLGMNWDDLYFQSQRFDLYREYAEKLVNEGKAYRDGEAIILTMLQQDVKVFDLIRGEINFDTATLKDQVLMKSDGSPAYSFACVLDDHLMGISHVIRGEDHISNTPKQIMIYEALGFKPPKYAHLPLIMGEDGGRLSKRTGAVAVSDYRREGFLPEALVNYLMLLGWSPGNNQEKIDLDNALKKFSIKKVNKAAAVFGMDKLRWLNGEYIKDLSSGELFELLEPFLKERGLLKEDFDRNTVLNIIELYKNRLSTLTDFVDRADFFFTEEVPFANGVREEHLAQDYSKEFSALAEKLGMLAVFGPKEVEEVYQGIVEQAGLNKSALIHPLRVALTGKSIGPSLFHIIALLGKDKTLKRLSQAFKS